MNNSEQNQLQSRPTRQEDYSEWYQQVIKAADLAENSPVRGCMVIKPWGWSIWELIRDALRSDESKKLAMKTPIFRFLFLLAF